MRKRVKCILLLGLFVFSCFAGCGRNKKDNRSEIPDPYAGMDHGSVSADLYEKVLGEFDKYYTEALEADTVSQRFARMAVAEAKLLGSGVMLPSTANGGNYAISRVVPNTVSSVLWGNDSDRFYSALVVEGEPLTPEIREEMQAKWSVSSSGSAYLTWAKEYLTAKGKVLTDTYTVAYDSDPKSWDALATSNAEDSEAIVNTFDGLMTYDVKNNQVYALARAHSVSADGLTYTFQLREGVQWVDYQGSVIEELTADSFVAGFQHMLDAQGGQESLVDGVVKNAGAYLRGEITDFSQVGVKAVDRYTLSYTLEQPASYFMSMLGYNVFAPMSRSFFLAKGGAFGQESYGEASGNPDSYVYGSSHENIAYCGPYLVRSAVAENTIVFSPNDRYWNREGINISTLTWKFVSGKSKTEAYDLMKEGTLAGTGLNADATAKAKADGWFEKYAHVSGTDASTFPIFLNLYRAQYGNFNDETVAPTTLNGTQKVRANLAMQNRNFRLALVTALDRASYNAAIVGDDLKLTSLVNSYTPGNFVRLSEAVTLKMGEREVTFPEGTYYGQILQAQLEADGIPVTVWDPQGEGGLGSSSGFDGWYDPEYSRENLRKAMEELKALGVEISRGTPLKLEIPYYDVSETYANRAAALEKSIEATTEGLIDIVLIPTGGDKRANWNFATYNPQSGDDMNFNLMDNAGWGPDYGDPATYLDTMYYGGYMLKCIGLF